MQRNIGNVSCNDVHWVGVITTPVSYLLITTRMGFNEIQMRQIVIVAYSLRKFLALREKNYVTRMNVNNSFCINN